MKSKELEEWAREQMLLTHEEGLKWHDEYAKSRDKSHLVNMANLFGQADAFSAMLDHLRDNHE